MLRIVSGNMTNLAIAYLHQAMSVMIFSVLRAVGESCYHFFRILAPFLSMIIDSALLFTKQYLVKSRSCKILVNSCPIL